MNQKWHSNCKRHWPCVSAPPFKMALFERRNRLDMTVRVVAYQNRRDGCTGAWVDNGDVLGGASAEAEVRQ